MKLTEDKLKELILETMGRQTYRQKLRQIAKILTRILPDFRGLFDIERQMNAKYERDRKSIEIKMYTRTDPVIPEGGGVITTNIQYPSYQIGKPGKKPPEVIQIQVSAPMFNYDKTNMPKVYKQQSLTFDQIIQDDGKVLSQIMKAFADELQDAGYVK
jgi:hypothetical protein